jgi:anti-sigma regulatory factor (Ser/Thr protein kinase)
MARRFARAALIESSADVDTVILLVSEVVTNAVLHARGGIRLVVEDRDAVARVEVFDSSPLPPRMHHFRLASATGRGLRLLDQLSQTWGVERVSDDGKVVWFEVGSSDDTVWESFADDLLADELHHEL